MKYDIEAIKQRKIRFNLLKNILKEILYIFLIIIIYNVFLVAESSLKNTEEKEIFGYKAYIISTQSMSPTIKEGDIIIVVKEDEKNIRANDIITFKKDDEIVTHRIIDINESEAKYMTKGDNNNIADSEEVRYKDVEGVVIFKIPLLGKIIMMLKNKIYVLILLVLVCALVIHYRKTEKRKETRREKKKIEDQKFKKDN